MHLQIFRALKSILCLLIDITHTKTLYTRHVIKTAQNATPIPRVQSLKKKSLELKEYWKGWLLHATASSRQYIKYNVGIRFALPKSQPRLYNVQRRVTAVTVPFRTNRTKFTPKEPNLHSGHRQERTQASTYTDEVVALADWQTVLYCVLLNSVTRARSATEGTGCPKCVRAVFRSLLSAFGLTKYPTLSTSTIKWINVIKWMQCEADKSTCRWQQECVQLHIRALFTRLRRSVSSQGRQNF